MMSLQVPLPFNTIHSLLNLRDIPNHSRFLMFHPPYSWGLEIVCQSTKCIFYLPSMLPQRKVNMKCLRHLKIDFGMRARENQYTANPERTNLTRINLPPSDSIL